MVLIDDRLHHLANIESLLSAGVGFIRQDVADARETLLTVFAVDIIANVAMYTGYSSTEQTDKVERRASPPARTCETPVAPCAVKATTDNILPFSLAAATGEEVLEQRLDAIGQLYRVERALSNLQSSRVFQAFSDTQKYEYYQVLGDVRSLMREISKQGVESKVAS
jgi:hypothetical protein